MEICVKSREGTARPPHASLDSNGCSLKVTLEGTRVTAQGRLRTHSLVSGNHAKHIQWLFWSWKSPVVDIGEVKDRAVHTKQEEKQHRVGPSMSHYFGLHEIQGQAFPALGPLTDDFLHRFRPGNQNCLRMWKECAFPWPKFSSVGHRSSLWS